MEGTQNRASLKEDSTIKDKHSRQFSDSKVIYWFCRQGGVWPVLCCQVQNSNYFNCGIPQLLVYFLKAVSYTHVPRTSARNRIVSEILGIAWALGSRQAPPCARKCNHAWQRYPWICNETWRPVHNCVTVWRGHHKYGWSSSTVVNADGLRSQTGSNKQSKILGKAKRVLDKRIPDRKNDRPEGESSASREVNDYS